MHRMCFAIIVTFVGVLGSSCPASAIDLWPFNNHKSEEAPPQVSDPAQPPAQRQFSTPRPLVGNMPMSERKGWMVDLTPPKRSWWPSLPKRDKTPPSQTEMQTQLAPPSQPDQPGILSSATSGLKSAGQKTAQATRKTWNSTTNFFRWGPTKAREEQYARVQQQRQQAAAEQKEPGFFSKLFNPQPDEPQGARTVTEFIAQERPGMTK